jgi:branched-chain amino acid transport system permease protein
VNKTNRNEILAILIMASMFLLVGFGQSWSLSLSILNMCIISAVMSMGINIQWGYAGIFNVGIMGFTALGGLAAVLVSYSPVGEAWRVGGIGMIISLFLLIITIVAVFFLNRVFRNSSYKYWIIGLTIIIGLILIKGASIFDGPSNGTREGFAHGDQDRFVHVGRDQGLRDLESVQEAVARVL